MKSKADLHNHLRTFTKRDFNNNGDFNRAIDIIARRLGENGVVSVTTFDDRNYERFIDSDSKGYERVPVGINKQGVYVPEKKVLIVKSQEVPTKRGHLLVLGLGYDENLKQNRSLEETISEADDKTNGEAIKIADHMFFASGVGFYLEYCPELIHYFDAFEINGEAVYGNKKAKRFYSKVKPKNPQLGILFSSDGHSFHELGKSWTEIDFPDIENPNEFIFTLKQEINSTNLKTPRREHVSYLGFADHAAKLAARELGVKLGFGKYFLKMSQEK